MHYHVGVNRAGYLPETIASVADTREEAERRAAGHCNVIYVPLALWESLDRYQRLYGPARELLQAAEELLFAITQWRQQAYRVEGCRLA